MIVYSTVIMTYNCSVVHLIKCCCQPKWCYQPNDNNDFITTSSIWAVIIHLLKVFEQSAICTVSYVIILIIQSLHCKFTKWESTENLTLTQSEICQKLSMLKSPNLLSLCVFSLNHIEHWTKLSNNWLTKIYFFFIFIFIYLFIYYFGQFFNFVSYNFEVWLCGMMWRCVNAWMGNTDRHYFTCCW